MRAIKLNVLLALLLCGGLAGCSVQSPEDQLSTGLATTRSWAATAELVGEAWSSGAVPTIYAQQTLQTAQKLLQQEAPALEQSQALNAAQHTTLATIQQRLAQALPELADSLAQNDRAAVTQRVAEIRAQEQALQALERELGLEP